MQYQCYTDKNYTTRLGWYMSGWTDRLSFAQRQRLQFMETILLWEGTIQRRDVCEVFKVTPNHLTRDLRLYRGHNKKALEYDVETRAYRRGRRFKALFASGSPDEYLALLQAYAVSRSMAVIPALGHAVTAEVLPQPSGQIDSDVLRKMIRAMREKTGVAVTYQSFREPNPSKRILWPHSLVFTGDRWHVRAYDQRHEGFRDFVLVRITQPEMVETLAPKSVEEDKMWQESEFVEIMPASTLSPSQRETVAREYGMERVKNRYVWNVELRKCFIPYFLYRHRLDARESRRQHTDRRTLPRIMLCDPTIAELYTFKDT